MQRTRLSKSEKAVNQSDSISRIKRIIGQLKGIEKMLTEERSARDVLQQTRAVISAVKAIEVEVIKNQLSKGIREFSKTRSETIVEKKLRDLLKLLKN